MASIPKSWQEAGRVHAAARGAQRVSQWKMGLGDSSLYVRGSFILRILLWLPWSFKVAIDLGSRKLALRDGSHCWVCVNVHAGLGRREEEG